MVCIYCGHATAVTNSRLNQRTNETWRRRACTACKAIFTSYEAAALDGSIVVQYTQKDLRPFSRDQLYLDVYASCKHLAEASRLATELTRVIIGKLIPQAVGGVLTRDMVTAECVAVLGRFNGAAAAIYNAYHPRHTS
jgi:transcriptional regulator NrdR family protein